MVIAALSATAVSAASETSEVETMPESDGVLGGGPRVGQLSPLGDDVTPLMINAPLKGPVMVGKWCGVRRRRLLSAIRRVRGRVSSQYARLIYETSVCPLCSV
ncbi:hypothetical protein EVAR_103802_1 [Eumeta japonica]|uniref:Uncharacterized protein n=1 Tax=Eumeta variegata TaxID=151549 RepID=A0A4C1Z4G1_EUMVA|nr:hypothetical protein EVAR_103802_1 [Eumeta japonica]